ncbi:MAG: hypothetical protein GOVbin4685_44 [Prokaryotic dsDNA virus sp.]|jgi:hypothetical protein|nr:MAG: hypothetical protein GOVbin4685_44 [Prokaryotic dsDNA virus sp.]|tara:strand:+ start:4512 stop:4757 length:246 start_codon:yes stop_codon:yes gene_type:complete
MRRLLNLFTRKPTPPPQVLDVTAARKRAEQRDMLTKVEAIAEREGACLAYMQAVESRNTQRQHKAAKRVRRATDRCLELGV